MTSLFDQDNRLNQWLGEKASNSSWGNNLRLNNGDTVIFQFVGNGDDGDRFIKLYRSHEVKTTFRNGQVGNTTRYCPTANGEPGECPLCAQNETKFKERMSIWMYVANILHTTMPADKQFPTVQYQGRMYFNEEINGFRVWHNSAWQESPWVDIKKLFGMYNGLHNFTAQMDAIGDGTKRRYKLYPLPNSSGLDPAIYEQARAELEPLTEMLHKEIASAVVVAPAPSTGSPVGQVVQPFAPLGGNSAAPAFTPLFTAPAAPPTTPANEMPAPIPAGAAGLGFGNMQPPVPPPAPVQEQNTGEDPAVPPVETDARRPLQSLF